MVENNYFCGYIDFMEETMNPVKDIMGQKFGRLTVIKRDGSDNRGYATWLCKCKCGNITKPLRSKDLSSGNTKSCGCLNIEASTARIKAQNITHGMKGKRTYRCWGAMKQRCLNPNCNIWENYGKRGITVSQYVNVS